MSQGRKQIERLEGCLTPNQAVIVWLEEIAQCQDFFEFVAYLRNQSESARPLRRLPDQLGRAIEQAMKGQPKETVKAEVRRASRDVAFLFYLHRHVNIKVTEPQRAWILELGFLRERLCRLIAKQTADANRSNKAVERQEQKIYDSLKQDWIETVRGFLVELYAIQDAVRFISRSYFSGVELLFPNLKESLVAIVAGTEESIEIFNHLGEKHTKDEKRRLDLKALRQDSSKETSRQVEMIVLMAKSDALSFMGDDKGALELVQHLSEIVSV